MAEQRDQRVVRASPARRIASLHQRRADPLRAGGPGSTRDRAEAERLVLLDVGLAERHVADDRVAVERRRGRGGRGRRRRAARRRSRPRASLGRERGELQRADGGVVVRCFGADRVTARRCASPAASTTRLALARGERDRQLGVVGGELGGGDRQAAERLRERQRRCSPGGRRCRAARRARRCPRRCGSPMAGAGRMSGSGLGGAGTAALAGMTATSSPSVICDVGVGVGLEHRRLAVAARRRGARRACALERCLERAHGRDLLAVAGERHQRGRVHHGSASGAA